MVATTSPIAGLEARWKANREQIVANLTAKIRSGEYGLGSDGIVRGAGGFELDINTCPGDWSNSQGISDDSIRLGFTTAKSGSLAAYGAIGDGMDAYFQYVNGSGGIDGRNIVLIQKDDGYVASRTVNLVNEFIASEDIFGVSTLGSPNSMSVYDRLNAQCTPQPFVASGHPAWGDPINHPWTTGLQLSYSTEAALWGEWIRANLTDKLPVTVAGLVMDNDFGLSYEQSMQSYVSANPDVVSEFIAVRHNPATPNLTYEMLSIAATDPDVFIAMTAGNPCLLAITAADATGVSKNADAMFSPSVCQGVSAYMAPAGGAADGWLVVGGGWKDITDPSTKDDVYLDFVRIQLEARGYDSDDSLYGAGFSRYGFVQVETLRIASRLPGGLTRTNWLLAMRHLSLDHPGLLPGIALELEGAADSYAVEGSEILQFDATSRTWNQTGRTVDFNGSSPNCHWDTTGGSACR